MQVTEPIDEAVNSQSITMMEFQGVNNEADVNQSTLEIHNKTTGGSMRNVSTIKGIHIDQNLSQGTNSREMQRQSAADFALASAKQSVKSQDTAEVVSKGGNVPDQYRENHRRRDNYLTTLLSQKVSEKTNVLSRMQQQAPMKVKINESHQEIQQFGHSTGRITLGLEKAASLHSSDQNYYDPHRIQLNSVDIKMMKNSFIETSRRRLNSGDQEGNMRERLQSMASKDGTNKDSMIALTQYARRQPSAEVGFPLITNSVQVAKRVDMQIDIGIKNGHAKEIEDEVIQIGSTQLSRSDAKFNKRHLKGVSVEIPRKSAKMPLPLGGTADKRNDVTQMMVSEMENDSRMISPGARFRRPQAHQIILESQDSTLDSSKMHIYNSKNYQPNNDVTRLLLNPEQALKKNLKPIKTAHNKDRPPLRSLFSTRQSKKGRSPLQSSFQNESARYKRQSPTQVLQLSHDVKVAMQNQNTELGTLGGLHERNMTQLPAGGKLSQNQQIIESLDMTTKLDLLRKSKYETHSTNSPTKSLAKIIESAQQSSADISQKKLDKDYLSTEGDLVSAYSQPEGVFYQPDKIRGEQRMGQLKLGLKSPPVRSPFRPSGTGPVSYLMTAPGTNEPLIESERDNKNGMLQTLPGTADISNVLTAGANPHMMNLSQSVAMPSSNFFDRPMPVIVNDGNTQSRNVVGEPRCDSVFSRIPQTSPSKEWIYVPQPSQGADTSRVLKKKHHVMAQDQIKLLEQKIKEKKRNNDKLAQKVKDRTDAMHKQELMTEKIMEYKRRQSETAMTLQMSLDPNTSMFNPSITEQSMSMHQSIDSQIETSVKQSQVHSLYKKLITGDLETSKQKTEAQLSAERWNVEQAYIGVEELQEENKILKRNIKRAKEVLEQKQEEVRKRERKLAAIEKGIGRMSDLDSNSLRDTDNHSMASFSAMGGYGSQRIDIKKVEQINQNVQLILLSKTPLETMLQVLKTFKQAIKNVGRCTIFVVNRYLQAYVFKDMHEQKRFFKAIQMGGRNNIVYAIYNDIEEYCKPTFTSIQGASKAQYNQRQIYIPIFYDQLLMFAVQLESDAPTAATIGALPSPSKVSKNYSQQVGEIKSKTSSILGRSMTVRSKPSHASRMSDGFSVSRRANPLRSMWNNNDFTVCKIISTLVKARMQIFTYNIQKEQKQKMKARVIKFVTSFIQHRTFKSLISQVKTDLPKLLGYKQAEVFSYDYPTNQLYCMSIRPNVDSRDPDQDPPGFEEDYIINEKQIVRFPTHMGVSGYAHRGDAVCYINDFAHKKATVIGPIIPNVASSRQHVLTLPQQAFVGKLLAKNSPYNRKIDNFLELEYVDNFVISSIQDEEVLGKTRSNGILQLFNRVASDILQDDLVRIHYIRKLIGSMMVSCEMYSITFELTVGMARAQDNQNLMKEMAQSISYGHMNNLKQSIQSMSRRLEEGNDEHQRDQLDTIAEETRSQ